MTDESEAPTGTERRSRVAAAIGGTVLPAWVARAIDAVDDSDVADLVALIEMPMQRRARGGARVAPAAVFGLYSRLDRRWFGGKGNAMEPVDTRGRRWSHVTMTNPNDIATIEALEVDVILSFVPEVPARLGETARFGVWRFDPKLLADARFGFWQVARREPVVNVELLGDLAGEREPLVLQRTRARTMKSSVARNADHARWLASTFPARALADLARRGDDWVAWAKSRDASRVEDTAPDPGLAATTAHVAGLAWGAVKGAVANRSVRRQWCLAYDLGPPDPEALDHLQNFSKLIPPNDCFWADPFPVEHEGRHYIFFEELPFATRKGHLCVAEVDEAGLVAAPARVLEADFHLSYPFVFEYEGEFFMMPETMRNESIELYRATGFPFEWKPERTLFDGVLAADSTIAHLAGRYWLFTCIAPTPASACIEELHLFHADSPLGPWAPHPRNPVVRDARCARPAGPVFVHRGGAFRPAQDCSGLLGGAVNLRRITCITPDDYEEVEHRVIGPDYLPGAHRIHTFSVGKNMLVIDAMRHFSRLGGPADLPSRPRGAAGAKTR